MNNNEGRPRNSEKDPQKTRNNYIKRTASRNNGQGEKPVPQGSRPGQNRENVPRFAGRHPAGGNNPAPVQNEKNVFSLRMILSVIRDRIRTAWLSVFIDKYDVYKALIISACIMLNGILQITVFARVKPFGATPDLLLPLVCAVAVSEGEKWGSVFALIAAFFIDCIGGTGLTLLPLVYTPAAFCAGVMGRYLVKDSILFRSIFILSAGVLKAISTIICTLAAFSTVTASSLFGKIVLPEYLSTAVFSVIPHVALYFFLKPFHKTRSERVGKQ